MSLRKVSEYYGIRSSVSKEKENCVYVKYTLIFLSRIGVNLTVADLYMYLGLTRFGVETLLISGLVMVLCIWQQLLIGTAKLS